jgi:hypothetical protein
VFTTSSFKGKIMNIFEQASRQKIRFSSNKGDLTTEQLWDLPLTSKTQFDLDTIAKTVHASLALVSTTSFVTQVSDPAKSRLELAMELVKHVIAVRVAENQAANDRAKARAERDRLINVLADKQDQALREMSADEIKARLADLEKAL